MINGVTLKINADDAILRALREDITNEDVSANSVMSDGAVGTAELIAKQEGILAGLDIFQRVFELLDDEIEFDAAFRDGDQVSAGDLIGTLRGNMGVLLSGERTALNFLQRMSGVATMTSQYVKELEKTNTRLLDTRKTTPGMRLFEKYAVKVGGGENHRYNLSDGVMLKDNHIGAAGGITNAIERAREYAPFVRKIEVEVENLEMVEEALKAGADIIMLDNMSNADMERAVKMIDGRALTECSGNVTQGRLKEIAATGVDFVSSGALTHSAPIMDVSLKNMRPLGVSIERLLEDLRENGFTEQANHLESSAKPSIRMNTKPCQEEKFEIGQSKVGGKPHLPKGVRWPKYQGDPMAFLAQINLQEVADFDQSTQFPAEGILYFFYEGGEDVWGSEPEDKDGFKVIYYNEDLSKLRIASFPGQLEKDKKFRPCSVTFSNETSYDMNYINEFLFDRYDENLSVAAEKAVDKLIETHMGEDSDQCISKLLGYPDLIQGDIFRDCQLASNGLPSEDPFDELDDEPLQIDEQEMDEYEEQAAELEKGVSDWLLLFQIDSDDHADMMWGDVGRVYFTIKKDDLKDEKFENAWIAFQCS